jgi:replicative DNA helicase
MIELKTIPFSAESERAVLGSILVDNGALAVAQEQLTPADFYRPAHRLIYATMLLLAEKGATADLVTLSEALGPEGVRKADGAAYVSTLTDGVPIGTVASVREYVGIVRAKADARRIIGIANTIAVKAAEGVASPEDLTDDAINALMELDAGRDAVKPSASFRQAALALLRQLESKDLFRVETGIPKLDAVTGGFLAGELVVLTAEVGAGKTILAQQIRRQSCARGQHGLFASAEMLKEQLAAREVAGPAGVPRFKMRYPERLSKDDWQNLKRAAEKECAECQILDGEITMARVAATAKRMKAAGRLSLVILDYDELIGAAGRDDFEKQAAIAHASKSLAKQMAVPVILVSQLRKLQEHEDRRRPTLDRLFGASAKRKHASSIIYIWRKFTETLEKADESIAALAVLKNRNGTGGYIPAHFDVGKLEYRELTREEEAARQKEKGAECKAQPRKRPEMLPYA